MTLRDQLATDLLSVLNTNEMAEQFTYIPKNGPPRTVTGNVVRETRDEEDEYGTRRVEMATITVGRNPNDATLGGIDQPQSGDQIVLSDRSKFKWQEEIKDQDPVSWTLEFRRGDLSRQGG